jgi:hypothetical protein
VNKISVPLVLLLALSVSAPALAEPPPERPSPGQDQWAKSQGGRFGFEVDVLSSSHKVQAAPDAAPVESSRLGIGVTVVGQFKIFAGLYLDAEMPLAYSDLTGPQSADLLGEKVETGSGGSAFVFGNPTLGLHYSANLLPKLALFGGLTGSVPIIKDPGSDTALAAAANVPARAYFDAHRLLLEHASMRVRLGAEVKFLSVLYYRGDLTWLLAFPTSDTGETKTVIEQGNEIELRAPGGFGFGFRFQTAMPLSADDIAQTAAEPFLSYEPLGKGSFFRAGFLVALDEQLGFGLDPGKVATGRIIFGGKY